MSLSTEPPDSWPPIPGEDRSAASAPVLRTLAWGPA